MNKHDAELIVQEWESRTDEIVLAGDDLVLPNPGNAESAVRAGHIAYSNGSVKRWELIGKFRAYGALSQEVYESARRLLEAINRPAISDRSEKSYLSVIAALTEALAAEVPDLKKRDGEINIGYSKDTGDAGVVGHLIKNEFTTLKGETLRKRIAEAMKAK